MGAVALFLTAAGLQAQTDVWIGEFPDDNASSPANWVGGVVPAGIDAGTDTLALSNNASIVIIADLPMSLLGITAVQENYSSGSFYLGGGSPVGIGAGGISLSSTQDGGTPTLTIDAPLMLSGTQTWTGGDITVNSLVQGTGLLALANGSVITFNNGSSTYTGGVTVAGFANVILGGSGHPLGYGSVDVLDGGAIYVNAGSTIALDSTVQLGDDSNGSAINLGAYSQDNTKFSTFTFGSSVTMVPNSDSGAQTLSITNNSEVVFAGSVMGFSGEQLNLETSGGNGSTPAIAIFQGSIGGIATIDLIGQNSVIFDGTGSSQLLSSGIVSILGNMSRTDIYNGSYVGFGKNYSGSINSIIQSPLFAPASFTGSIGLDTTSGAAATFVDNINLSAFTNSNFVGLGSATQAIFSGIITRAGDPDNFGASLYQFGGGGGKLTVTGDLDNGSTFANTLEMLPGNAPLTLVLSGSNTYTGETIVDGGVLVFDSPFSSGMFHMGEDSLVYGYIGISQNAGFSDANPQVFINKFDSGSTGVAGFDNFSATRTITGNISLIGYSGLYLGSASNVTFTGTITTSDDSTFKFSGVKGGVVTVDSGLTSGNYLLVGLPDPIESFNSVSTVIIPDVNTFSGGTTLYSGYLEMVTGAVGNGTIEIAGPPDDGTGTVVGIKPYNADLIIGNAISVPYEGAHINYASSPYSVTLNGVISDTEYGGSLIIDGPTVITNGSNTYTGGTIVNGTTLQVTADRAVGDGSLTASAGAVVTFISENPEVGNDGSVTLNDATLTFTGAVGSPSITNLIMEAGSTLNFAANSQPIIYYMASDLPGSGNTINLGAGANLTFDFNDDPDFHGSITGATGSITVEGASLNLTGNSTYGGGTLVDSYTLLVASSSNALGTGAVTVNGTLGVNTGVTLTNPLILGTGGTLAGYGTFSPGGTVTLQSGATVVPGNANTGVGNSLLQPVGLLTFGAGTSVAFGPSGGYNFSVIDAYGAAGVGYSTLNVSGTLSITANSADPFSVNLYSFVANNNNVGANPVSNFSSNNAYSWTLATATGGITGFNTSSFTISTGNFLNGLGTGEFYVSQSGDQLLLNFNPVPEPSTVALGMVGVAGVGLVLWRRRRVKA